MVERCQRSSGSVRGENLDYDLGDNKKCKRCLSDCSEGRREIGLIERKVKGAEVEVREEEKQLPRIENNIPRMKKRSLIITQKGEEVHKGDTMLIGTLFLEQEEEEEAKEVK
jgi:hypothetical protein